jgi:hypothetical protein
MNYSKEISTGIKSLDEILNYLLLGDNVVWHIPSIIEYKKFISPFVKNSIANKKEIHYIRFADHPLIIEDNHPLIHTYYIDPKNGFEIFSQQIHDIITEAGERAYFVFDCLSSLLDYWVTDNMVGNFFLVTCPYLFKQNTIAYFGLLKNCHSFSTINKIKKTTQIFLELYSYNSNHYIHPQKVSNRASPTMFLPHKLGDDNVLRPVANSVEATSLYYSLCSTNSVAQKKLDAWDKMMLKAQKAVATNDIEEKEKIFDTISHSIVGRDKKILKLIKKHLTLSDLLSIKSRMIGTGYIGGKAAGMLLSRKILENSDKLWSELLEAHDSYFIGSDVFHSYIIHNGWWDIYMLHKKKEHYFQAGRELEELMLTGEFPDEILYHFREMLDYFGQYPIIVRSSSILEDGFGNAFAGKYESFFCSVQGSPQVRLEEFLYNLKRVYASIMCQDALEYRKKKGLAEADEQMGILIQRVSGCFHGYYYYPHISGVGLSYNIYVWHDSIDPEAGMLRLVTGLGTRAVNRVKDDYPRIVALNVPNIVPFYDIAETKKFSQKFLDVLDTRSSGKHEISLYDLYNEKFPFDLNKIAIHDESAEEMLSKKGVKKDVWIMTFENFLKNSNFANVMKNLLKTIEKEYEYPVDVEFTVNFTENDEYKINIVQCRPHQTNIISFANDFNSISLKDYSLLFSSKNNFMGGNVIIEIHQVVIVDPYKYSLLTQNEKYLVAKAISDINKTVDNTKLNTMLLGPGRWGTSTPSLGVPVRFSDISNMKVIAEIEFEEGGLMPELSFGSHFFQDLVETGIFYMALFKDSSKNSYNSELFDKYDDCFANLFTDYEELKNVIRVYQFKSSPLVLKSDIKSQEVLILKKV